MTSSELAKEVFSIVETKVLGKPSPAEFEMAYQARVAVEQIRFAIREVEKHMPSQDLYETSLQLADALDRLESADRHFLERFHLRTQVSTRESGKNHSKSAHNGVSEGLDSHQR